MFQTERRSTARSKRCNEDANCVNPSAQGEMHFSISWSDRNAEAMMSNSVTHTVGGAREHVTIVTILSLNADNFFCRQCSGFLNGCQNQLLMSQWLAHCSLSPMCS